jgi:hypothetical protein
MSGLEFFWACVVVGSLSVLEARMFGIVTVVLEARLGCAENRGVVAWGHDGFRPREGLTAARASRRFESWRSSGIRTDGVRL